MSEYPKRWSKTAGKLLPLAEWHAVEGRAERSHMVMSDIEPYTSPVDDTPIDGRKQHREALARRGMRVFEKGEHDDAVRHRQYEDRALERDIENYLREAF